MIKRRHAGEKKNMHIVGICKLRYTWGICITWGICKLSHNQPLCGAGWAVTPVCRSSATPPEPGGHSWQMAVAGLLRTASCPVLIHSPLGQLEMSRIVSEYKLQTNITIQYSNFFSPLLLSSIGYTRVAQATTNRSLRQVWKVWQGGLKQFLDKWEEIHFYSEQTAESHVWTSYSESTWIAEGIKEWK